MEKTETQYKGKFRLNFKVTPLRIKQVLVHVSLWSSQAKYICNFGFELAAFDYSKVISISSHCIHTKAISSLAYMQLQVHYEMFSCQVWSASHILDIHCISVP